MSEKGKKILPPRVPVISNAIFNSETISSSNFQEINQVVASDQVIGARRPAQAALYEAPLCPWAAKEPLSLRLR